MQLLGIIYQKFTDIVLIDCSQMISSIYVICQSHHGQNCSEVLEDYNYQVRNQYTIARCICVASQLFDCYGCTTKVTYSLDVTLICSLTKNVFPTFLQLPQQLNDGICSVTNVCSPGCIEVIYTYSQLVNYIASYITNYNSQTCHVSTCSYQLQSHSYKLTSYIT